MNDVSPITLHASLALSSLQEASEDVREALDTLTRLRAVRDAYIRDARRSGVSAAKVMEVTGLSREAIHKIVGAGVSK